MLEQRFEVLEELARGGMGVVYRARQREPERVVALKVLLDQNDEELLLRFQREARALARLTHPGIVRVHEVGEAHMVMELVAGRSLKGVLREQGAFPPREAARVMAEVARAVQHAHDQGVLHRDLKPDNVILRPDGRVILIDFGIARGVEDERERLTQTGAILGTPSYMPPEQLLGAGYDERGDVYGLGATFYALLTSHAPITGASSLAILERVISTEPAAPSSLAEGVEPWVDEVCLRALAKDPEKRPASAAAFAELLEALARGERPGGERLALPVVALALVAMLAITVTGVLLALQVGGDGGEVSRPSVRRSAVPTPSATTQRKTSGQRRVRELIAAARSWDTKRNQSANFQERLGVYEALWSLELPPESSAWAERKRFWNRRATKPLAFVPLGSGAAKGPSDAKLEVVGDRLWIYGHNGLRRLSIDPFQLTDEFAGEYVSGLAWDGRRLLFGSRSGLRSIDADGAVSARHPLEFWKRPEHGVRADASPHHLRRVGDYLCVSLETELLVLDLELKLVARTEHALPFTTLGAHPSERDLLVCASGRTVREDALKRPPVVSKAGRRPNAVTLYRLPNLEIVAHLPTGPCSRGVVFIGADRFVVAGTAEPPFDVTRVDGSWSRTGTTFLRADQQPLVPAICRGLVADERHLYVLYDDRLIAYDLQTHKKLWSGELEWGDSSSRVNMSGLARHGHYLFLGTWRGGVLVMTTRRYEDR